MNFIRCTSPVNHMGVLTRAGVRILMMGASCSGVVHHLRDGQIEADAHRVRVADPQQTHYS